MGKHKNPYHNNKIKVSALKWNDELEVSGGSYSVSDIQNFFEYTIKEYETLNDKPYVKKFRKSCEKMQLIGNTKKKIIKDKMIKICLI